MTSVGVMASAVVTSACTAVLDEPFDNLTRWAVSGTPTLVAGRNGTGVSVASSTNRIDYTIPAAAESDTVTIGFAWRTTTVSTNSREVVLFYGENNTELEARLGYDGTTAQSLSFRGPGVVLGTTATGLIPVNTWAFIEVQMRRHNTLGTAIVRVNGVQVLNLTGLDTEGTGVTKTTIDAIRLYPNAVGITNQYDDLYISTGPACAFQGDHAIANGGPDILLEPFNHLASWAISSSPALVTGRNGNGAEINSISDQLNYNIPSALQSDTLTVGFAWRSPVLQGSHIICGFRSDAGVTLHTTLETDSGGRLKISRSGLVLAVTAVGAIAANTWYYLETATKLHDTLGTIEVRIDGVTTLNATGLDTKDGGTKTVYDQIRLSTPSAGSGGTNQYDDLYIAVGTAFKGDIVIS